MLFVEVSSLRAQLDILDPIRFNVYTGLGNSNWNSSNLARDSLTLRSTTNDLYTNVYNTILTQLFNNFDFVLDSIRYNLLLLLLFLPILIRIGIRIYYP